MIDPATATLLAGLLSSAPGIAQTLFGGAQSRRARQFGEGLERPDMPIPEASADALETIRALAGGLQMPGYENAINSIMQTMAGTGYQVDQAATTSAQALGAITQAGGQQMSMLNNLAMQSAQNKMDREMTYADALSTFGQLQKEQWFQNMFGDYQERANASAALGGAGIQNKYGGLSDIFGALASMLPMLAKSGTGTGTGTPGGSPNVDALKTIIGSMGMGSQPAPELPKSITRPDGTEMMLTPEQAATMIPGAAIDYGKSVSSINYPPKNFTPAQPSGITAPILSPGVFGGTEVPFAAGAMGESTSMFSFDPAQLDWLRAALGIGTGGSGINYAIIDGEK